MKKITLLFLLSFVGIISLSAFAKEDDPFAILLKKLQEIGKKYPQEKVHLHLDKPYYAIGDDIWFKAYITDAVTTLPTTISKILYVELINEKDSVKQQIKLPITAGITWGDFKLTDSLSEGNYRIRAYTQWMRNAGTAFFFDKTIKIGNSWANKVFTLSKNEFNSNEKGENLKTIIQFKDKNGVPYVNNEVSYELKLSGKNISKGKTSTNAQGEINIPVVNNQPNLFQTGQIVATITLDNKQKVVKTIPLTSTSSSIDVQFFPEGGSLVHGLPSKIGIKSINARGLGENIKGRITDNLGNDVVAFETSYLGMGNFILNPDSGKTYSAIVDLGNGAEKIIKLPKVQSAGYVLSVNNADSSKLSIKIFLSESLLHKGELNLIAQRNGEVYFYSKIPSNKQYVAVNVPKKDLPSGIIHLTLFSPENLPVCERLAFVNNTSDKIDIELDSLKLTYRPRSNVSLLLKSTVDTQSVAGSFSLSVTNSSAVKPDVENETNIFTSLLLTSDLKGYVEKPNYYFINNDAQTQLALDNLLLTQGWRKIDWATVLNDQNTTPLFEAEQTMKIAGRITKNGKPVVNGKVSLFSNTGGFFATDTLSNAEGKFNFDQIEFADSTKFIVQARTDKNNKNVQIDLDIVPTQLVTANKNSGDVEMNINESLMDYLQKSNAFFDEQTKKGFLNRTVMLQEVKIVETKNLTPNSSNLNRSGSADQTFTAKDLETAFSLSQYLQGRVVGVTIRNGMAYSNRANGGAMNIVLDGMNMGEDFQLDDIVVQDIESVEVLRTIGNTAIYGSNGTNGVLVITTKRGGNTSSDYNRYTPGIVTYSPKGYQISREFYSPKYNVNPEKNRDLRTTVYWNPHLNTDKNGNVIVNYFNTDMSGNYRIVVEGIDYFGNIGRKVYNYEVK